MSDEIIIELDQDSVCIKPSVNRHAKLNHL